jgi:hypothetical protein
MAKRKKKTSQLLRGFLEGISWKVLEEYQPIVRQLIRGRSGVYALYRQDRLYYVGLASNLMGRLKGHLRDRHHGLWDRFSVYITIDDTHMKQLESLLLRITRPTGNRVAGGFGGPANLYRSLHRLMSADDADRRARILGGHVAERRRRTRAAEGSGTLRFAGLLGRRLPLRAEWKGQRHRATLRRDGRIGSKGRVYDSPTAAAAAVVGHAVNGWKFWKYRDAPRRWVYLSELRK